MQKIKQLWASFFQKDILIKIILVQIIFILFIFITNGTRLGLEHTGNIDIDSSPYGGFGITINRE